MLSHRHGYPDSDALTLSKGHQYIASEKSTGTTYSKVQEKVADGMADVRVGVTVVGIDVEIGTVAALTEGVILDVLVTGTLELDAVPEAEPNPVVDRDKAVLEGLLAQAATVPVDHDKLQSIVNLSSEKPGQALIWFRALI